MIAAFWILGCAEMPGVSEVLALFLSIPSVFHSFLGRLFA